ncbi:MAG: tetratricopeptide repeat protein [Deltaproteobacteria bacterium]
MQSAFFRFLGLAGAVFLFLFPAPVRAAEFSGALRCRGCHEAEFRAWQGSDHDRAMMLAAEEGAVLGDFGDARVESGGVAARFFRRDGGFFAVLHELDGTTQEVEIVHAFGTEPLQQYLVHGSSGRLQALTFAWDSRPQDAGGQRWFSLQVEGEAAPGDPLHWDGVAFRWNRMCADCHSTALRKEFRLAEKAYETAYAEIDVACESCHGPGSAHIAWAETGAAPPGNGFAIQLRGRGSWHRQEGARIAERAAGQGAESTAELQVCAPCHARRSQIGDPLAAHGRFLDAYRPQLLDEGLYFPDGQIQDEVYVYGSFLQSRMFAAGVTCSDCHDPHSLALREEGNALCGGCHGAATFDTAEHHFHETGTAGARCVSCHMPERTYMKVDPRRDHGFRVPRADLALELGVPLPCLDCHADRDAAWARTILEARGAQVDRPPAFPRALAAGRRGAAGARADLIRILRSSGEPGIARASAAALLASYPGTATDKALAEAARDGDALVRMGAASALEVLPPRERLRVGVALLGDATLAVRIEAGRALGDAPPEALGESGAAALAAALAEYRAAQQRNADWPEAHLNLGLLAARRGDLEVADAAYREALRVGPEFLPSYVNLADLLRQNGDETGAEEILRRGLARAPGSADLRHALGLALVRQGDTVAALSELARAAELAPQEPRYAYVLTVAKHSSGDLEGARELLQRALARHPQDAALLELGVSLSLQSGARAAVRGYAERLLLLRPNDPQLRKLMRDLDAAAAGGRSSDEKGARAR